MGSVSIVILESKFSNTKPASFYNQKRVVNSHAGAQPLSTHPASPWPWPLAPGPWGRVVPLKQHHLCLISLTAPPIKVTLAIRHYGLSAFGFELKVDKDLHDILSPRGYAFAITLILQMNPASMVWFPLQGLGSLLKGNTSFVFITNTLLLVENNPLFPFKECVDLIRKQDIVIGQKQNRLSLFRNKPLLLPKAIHCALSDPDICLIQAQCCSHSEARHCSHSKPRGLIQEIIHCSLVTIQKQNFSRPFVFLKTSFCPGGHTACTLSLPQVRNSVLLMGMDVQKLNWQIQLQGAWGCFLRGRYKGQYHGLPSCIVVLAGICQRLLSIS